MDHKEYKKIIIAHFSTNWGNAPTVKYFGAGRIEELPKGFCLLEFPPTKKQKMWAYATCGMSGIDEDELLELFMYSPVQSAETIEILTVITRFHSKGCRLNLHHTVNFGKPWMDGSILTHGLISLPYISGPKLETLYLEDKIVKYYWLIPVTEKERDYKKEFGVDALEDKFEERQFNYIDIYRKGVV